MAGLPWVRLDSSIPSHDKILALLDDPSSLRYRAAWSYICSIAWCGAQGTDGFVPRNALNYVHGNEKTARLLEKYRLWEEAAAGYRVHNYASRQQLSAVRDGLMEARASAGRKANCVRWHGDSCWKDGRCSRG